MIIELKIHDSSTSTSSKAQSSCLSFESLALGDEIKSSIIMSVNWFILSPSAWSSRHPFDPHHFIHSETRQSKKEEIIPEKEEIMPKVS
jgi:hypothetical protein